MKKKWIPAVVMSLIAIAVLALFAIFSRSMIDMVDDARRKDEQTSASTNVGGSTSNGSSTDTNISEQFIVEEGSFKMVKPTAMMEYRTDTSNESALYYGIKFLGYIDADVKRRYESSSMYTYEWFMIVAPVNTFHEAESEWDGQNISQNWEEAFIDLGKTYLKIGVTSSLAQDDVGNAYYELKSHMVEVKDKNVNRDFAGVLCVNQKSTFSGVVGTAYADIDFDQASDNLTTVSMEVLNQHYYSSRRGAGLYNEEQIAKLKETINIGHYMAEYNEPPTRNEDGSFVDQTVYERFFTVVIEDSIQLTVGQEDEIEYSFVSGSMEDPPILWDIDSFAYFILKDGKITGVAPCENVPLNVYICGQPYTILVTVK